MIRSRIAPTPSGFLHKGNAFNFMLTHRLVKQQNGKLALRIDDLDQGRTRPEYIGDIFDTLHWLGIAWEEGPLRAEDMPAYSQLNHSEEYLTYINRLKNKGHLFACDCPRSKLENTFIYPGTCLHRNLPFTHDTNWRLITPQRPVTFYDAFEKKERSINLYDTMRHPVIKKRDGSAAYQVASLADDVRMQVNMIVRGNDLADSTATQLYLAELLELDSFRNTQFYHHPLLAGTGEQKLSKSAGSPSIKEYCKTHSRDELYEEFEKWIEKIIVNRP